MKIYRCDFYCPTNGACVSWHGSKREAEGQLRDLQRHRGDKACGPEGVRVEDIPTDKVGLIAWLNGNLNQDNG